MVRKQHPLDRQYADVRIRSYQRQRIQNLNNDGVYRIFTFWDRSTITWCLMEFSNMSIEKKTRRDPFLFQLLFDLFGPENEQEAEVKQMSNMEFYIFLVIGTTAMFALSFLIKLVIGE
jgi:hypothetical protein